MSADALAHAAEEVVEFALTATPEEAAAARAWHELDAAAWPTASEPCGQARRALESSGRRDDRLVAVCESAAILTGAIEAASPSPAHGAGQVPVRSGSCRERRDVATVPRAAWPKPLWTPSSTSSNSASVPQAPSTPAGLQRPRPGVRVHVRASDLAAGVGVAA